ncbi:hypothetical protein SAMN05660649_02533 [Desulfotomaculum arcticum]|uniref:Uncharacterized protein n=1 Tax=Desulfotruncus arcticus DSM 17038 TaxID=1121424 RepID=A0A1I2U6N5_9FIRM|nr:hypothetical protein [Desulfotruncus arcticus]SFG72794.1 hypothetical protein SAMN05660649_02533 [Desulfotomaculum arcticum] [Desulfotruncus arcticus DSM 17038]
MRWEDVRKIYPNQFVKMQIFKSYIKDNKRYIEDMAVIKAFDDNNEATRELVRAKDDIIVYHTGNEKIEIEIKKIFGYRGVG